MMEDKQFKEIIERLDKLIRISASQLGSSVSTSTEKIILLQKSGFGPKEIADLLGTTPNAISVRLSEIKKRKMN